MTPDDFKRLWEADGDQLCPMLADDLSDIAVPTSTRSFLMKAGLPEDAAPFLSFSSDSRENASELLRMAMAPPEILVVGSTGAGDPVGVRLDGAFVYHDHDADFAERYINKDVETFAETALRMRHLIAEVQRLVGADAYLDGSIPADLKADFRSFLRDTDPSALEPGGLWIDEIARWS
jgi:hypothetical protein